MSNPLFSKYDLGAVLDLRVRNARQEVDAAGEDYLLNVSENDFVDHLVAKFSVDPPHLGEPFMLEPAEVDVDVSRNPIWGARAGHTHVKGCRVEIRVPFSGD